MSYSKEPIVQLTKFIMGDKDAQRWLLQNNYKELELLYYALKNYDGALKELSDKKHFEVAAFANAVKGNASALNWLMKNKKYEWAATVKVINKKKDAAMWLVHYKFDHYVHLANAIRSELVIENEGDFFGIISKWLKVIVRGPFNK